MTFSSKVKEELLKNLPQSRHCRLAMLAGIYVSGYPVRPGDTAQEPIDRLSELLDIDIESDEGRSALKLKTDEEKLPVIEPILVERSCCKQAFIRGSFIAAGSLTNPEKEYHFEIALLSRELAMLLMKLIKDFNIEPKLVERKKYHVVYVKESQEIADLLTLMGAHVSLLDMENIRIIKDMKNRVNRRVNCETANLNKTVSAAVRQVNDIEYIEQTRGLKSLPESLYEIAVLRLEQPDMALKDLGEMLNPPIGKSGVNHRLRKISEIADDIRRNKS
ncbi:MAG: DNA-binding protein WhiA [Lachnospiraceae bacterium]|nr:DNA-binding protein WhiA [Lachnospiraceae bacterium]